MHGSPKTKELKKTYSYGQVGGVETGSWAKRTHSKVMTGGLVRARRWLAESGRW